MRFSLFHGRISSRIVCASMIVLSITAANSKSTAWSPHRVFDEYGRICWENEQARLDNFAVRLEMSPEMIGNIIVYDGRRACRGEAIARAVRAKRYLVGYRHIDASRVLWRFGGYQEELNTILMDVPRGYSEWPAGDPILISPKDVVFMATATTVYDQRAVYGDAHNKSLDASGGSVFRNLIRPAMLD
jgi:hypothetical protein